MIGENGVVLFFAVHRFVYFWRHEVKERSIDIIAIFATITGEKVLPDKAMHRLGAHHKLMTHETDGRCIP